MTPFNWISGGFEEQVAGPTEFLPDLIGKNRVPDKEGSFSARKENNNY